MGSFAVTEHINASTKDVWRALAAIGDINQWNPGVISSHVTTESTTGLGARRYCDLGGKNYLDEEVVTWDEDRALTMRIVGTNLPFAAADICFTLQADGGKTVVQVSPDYRLKYGPLGALLDVMFVRRTYRKGMESLLRGLKEHVEAQVATPS